MIISGWGWNKNKFKFSLIKLIYCAKFKDKKIYLIKFGDNIKFEGRVNLANRQKFADKMTANLNTFAT